MFVNIYDNDFSCLRGFTKLVSTMTSLLYLFVAALSLRSAAGLAFAARCGAAMPSLRAPPPCAMLRRVATAERIMFIDGNNLMATRKVTKGRDALAAKLAGCMGREVVLVFDGKQGEAPSSSGTDPRVVVTAGGESGFERETADAWISREIASATQTRVEVVSADRALRRTAQLAKSQCINPSKFWRRYLPRLQGRKNDYVNAPKAQETGE